jgi:HSP20 family protein
MNYYISPRDYHLTRRWNGETANAAEFTLPVDIREEDAAYVISALVPGMKADDIRLQINDNVLTIEGVWQEDEETYLVRELPYGTFRRSLRLPVEVDGDLAEATVSDGLLTLRIPKVEAALPKTIKVISK